MIRRTQRSRALGLLGATLLAMDGCSTPTLPLPPPSALVATPPDADGIVTVEGDVLDDAWVFIVNLRTERGVIVRADEMGHFVARIEAEPGHYLDVWQLVGTDQGEHSAIEVPAP